MILKTFQQFFARKRFEKDFQDFLMVYGNAIIEPSFCLTEKTIYDNSLILIKNIPREN